jgi:bacillithiol synthase
MDVKALKSTGSSVFKLSPIMLSFDALFRSMPSFTKHTIPFSDTEMLPELVQDYIDGKCAWLTGYEHHNAFESVIAARSAKKFEHRQLLVDILKKQMTTLSGSQQANLEKLSSDATFTVTTGHQLNLFTGPLYFIYKILTTVKLAEELNAKYKDKHFVPLYWMASEDHDLQEVNHAFVFGKKIEWKTEQKGAVGRMLCDGVEQAIEELQSIAGVSTEAEKLVELLKQSYKAGTTMAGATRHLVNELFKETGLIILDADDSKLKEIFFPIMKDDMEKNTAYRLVNETIRELEKKSYDIQVRPRQVNVFCLGNNFRERFYKEEDSAALKVMAHENENILIDKLPYNCFSPNVILRTLYQETILPNIAYVGGPAEIAYWLELKSTFDYYNTSYPVLVLRNSAMILDADAVAKLKKLNLQPPDLFLSADALAKNYVLAHDHQFSITEEAKQIESAFDSLKQKIGEIDSTLMASADAEKVRQLNALKALEEKAIRAAKKRHETAVAQIQKLKARFFPENKLHERTDNFIPYYLKYGKAFFEVLKDSFEMPTKEIVVLKED